MIDFSERFCNIIIMISSLIEWLFCVVYINAIMKKKVTKFKYNIMISFFIILFVIARIFNFIVAGEIILNIERSITIRILCQLAVGFISYVLIRTLYKVKSANTIPIILAFLMLIFANLLHLIIRIFSNIIVPDQQWLVVLLFITILDYVFATVLYISSKTVKKYEMVYNEKDIPLILTSCVASFAIIAFLSIALVRSKNINLEELVIIFASSIVIMILNAVIFVLILRLASYIRAQKENEIKLMGSKVEQQYAESIKHRDDEFRKMRHDLKHHVSVVDTLLCNDKIDEAKKYLEEYLSSSAINNYVHTSNEYVNAIVNSKISLANENDVKISSVIANNISGVDNVDICNILGNLLDNAIEGCLDTKDKNVELKILSEDQMIRISVSNSISKSVLDNNKEFVTTKPDSENHGFGIKSIKEITSKYNGFLDYFEEGNKLTANVTLVKETHLYN